MKKLVCIVTVLFMSSFVMAESGFKAHPEQNLRHPHQIEKAQHGFYDESAVLKTVKEALTAKDHTPVMLEGYISKQLDDDEFLFKDDSGEIVIEVKNRVWRDLVVTPQDKIKIHGKVDKEWNKTEIDVKHIIKL